MRDLTTVSSELVLSISQRKIYLRHVRQTRSFLLLLLILSLPPRVGPESNLEKPVVSSPFPSDFSSPSAAASAAAPDEPVADDSRSFPLAERMGGGVDMLRGVISPRLEVEAPNR